MDKVKETLEYIDVCLSVAKNPICLCSFGKDSLVMLHLIMQIKKIPVIYWREPFFQKKFSYPQKIAELWDLDVYDYPPFAVDYVQLDNYFEVFNYYQAGKSFINLYTGIRKYKPEDRKVLCAITDLLFRPRVKEYDFRWDCIFHGQKTIDPVHITDKIDFKKTNWFGNGILCFAMKDWTNEDIWEYIHKNNLPYNSERYDKKDESVNNDLYPTCYDCLDCANKGKKVYCLRLNMEVPFVGKSKEENELYRDKLLNLMYK